MAGRRSPKRDEKALDQALRGMFSTVQARVLPDSLRHLIDQLEEARREPEEKAA